ncbi:MAG: mechanosensitive ion channel family protein [Desulfobulbaceae bacterium]|nr:mechanosensitive ion channel family protein [Desulfobulbaceae bacterium]
MELQKELAVLEDIFKVVAEFLINYSFQILGAFIILIIGFKVASWLSVLTTRLCEKHNIDVTLSRFIGNVARILVLTFVIIIAIGKFGITIAPFIAALGALAFGSSFALQGPLSNYGAGLAIILSRPFVVGNTITVKGVNGVVEEIRLAATILTTEDDEEIIIPNKHIVGEITLNSFGNRIVEASVGINYSDDPEKAIDLIQKTLAGIDDISKEPSPQIGIEEFADSAISIGVRFWVPTKQYFQLKYKVNLAIHKALKNGGITIPFPQRDVHLFPQE